MERISLLYDSTHTHTEFFPHVGQGLDKMQLFTLYSKSKACESQQLGWLASGGEKQPYGEVSCLPVRHLATTNHLNFSTLQPPL